jgi:hypothetical protein
MYKLKDGKTLVFKEIDHVILCVNCGQPIIYEPRFGWTHIFKGGPCVEAEPFIETAVVPVYKVPETYDEKLAVAYLNSDIDLVMGLLRTNTNISIATEEVRKNAAVETGGQQGNSEGNSGRRSSRESRTGNK